MATPAPTDSRPLVAFVANALSPYRHHLHRRIVREMPQIRLATILTHEVSNAPWALREDEQIGLVRFGPGEDTANQSRPRYALREWRKGGRIIRWLREHRASAVVMLGYNDLGRLRIIRWCRRMGIPCFLWGDSNIKGDAATGVRALAKRAIVGWALRRCEGAFACGRLGKAYWEKYGAPTGRIFISPYEPDYSLVQQLPQETIDATAQGFGIDPARRRIVYSGRLVPVKRVDLLMRSYAQIASERPEWDLLIVGSGELRKDLEALVPHSLRCRVQWTGFLDDQSTVSALYRLSDALVLPSENEPWALVINEAAAAGLAIVASDVVGAAAELVRDGINGRIFPSGDQTALTEALRDVTDPARIDAMKAASADVLADWRQHGDPVAGIRQALESVGVLGSPTDQK